MIERMFFGEGRQSVENFFLKEYPSLAGGVVTQIINFLPLLNDYQEESVPLRPTIIVCTSVDKIVRAIKSTHPLHVFVDDNETTFRMRMKSLAAFSRHGWYIFVESREDKTAETKNMHIRYGIMKAMNSVKEPTLERMLFADKSLEKKDIIFIRSLNKTAIKLKSITGNKLFIDFSLSRSSEITSTEPTIDDFVTDAFSKLRTTKQKMLDIKTLVINIFEKAFNSMSHGSICVIVDKDYIDTGFFEDGVWLKQPIEFSKLFTQSKSFSEPKLIEISNLLIDMLNYDGITIMDNTGRILAYHVFVETSSSKAANIVGGARKRAAYTIANTKRQKIVGVFFQSQDGETYYTRVKANEKIKKPKPSLSI